METVRDERFERFSVHFLRFRCSLCAREVRLAALAKGTPWARHPAGEGVLRAAKNLKKIQKIKHSQNGVNRWEMHGNCAG